MSREWNPGDVALIGFAESDPGAVAVFSGGGRWQCSDGEGHDHSPGQVKWVRPLVVIDPEDREQVKRLLETYGRQFTDWTPELDSNVTKLQAALRSLIAPPKPDEPTGLGAVVFASCECKPERRRFVRDDISDVHPEAPWKQDCGHHVWADLTLRDEHDLLSEGVRDAD